MKKTVGIVGARGYVGQELVGLIERHGELDLRMAVSQRDGKSPRDIAREPLDAYVLALPNGSTAPYVAAIFDAQPLAVVLDLSADHRFDASFTYGQPERMRDRIKTARRISNPGCYATAMQLALAPLVSLLDGPASIFGISGYSGAGTTKSKNNDPDALRDNLIPYALTGHVHEREVASQLGCRVFFMPHVASFFRGITVTVSVALSHRASVSDLFLRYREAYDQEPLVHVQEEIPLVRDIREKDGIVIGGLSLSEDGEHAVVVATIDNLRGGAATQALRNLNLALGFDENQGVLT